MEYKRENINVIVPRCNKCNGDLQSNRCDKEPWILFICPNCKIIYVPKWESRYDGDLDGTQVKLMDDLVASLQCFFDFDFVQEMEIIFDDCVTECNLVINTSPKEAYDDNLLDAEADFLYDNDCYIDFHHEWMEESE